MVWPSVYSQSGCQLTECYVLVQCILLGVAVYVIGDDLKMGDKNGQ